MKALLLDDEQAGLDALRQLLKPYEDVEVVAEAKDVNEALKATQEHQPEVAFLDVRLRGETAFDYVGQLAEPGPRLVFVTAYDQYAVRGFECNALDYLMKPVLPERLAATLERVRRHEVLERRAAQPDDSIFLRFEQIAKLVPWKGICLIQTSGNYTRVFMQDDVQPMSVLKTLKEWSPLLPEGQFVQVHRSSLVQVTAIRELKFLEGGRHELLLADGSVVPVSRGHWAELKTAIQAWHPEASRFLR